MTHIEVLKQALEALQNITNYEGLAGAREMLRQAIEQAEHIKVLKEKTEGHDVDCLCADCEAFDNLEDHFYSAGYTTGFMDASVKAHEAKKQSALDAKADNAREIGLDYEVEPFGIWHQGKTDDESDFYLFKDSGDVSCPDCIKLYTHPPVTQGHKPKAEQFDHQKAAQNGLREAMNRSQEIAKAAQPKAEQEPVAWKHYTRPLERRLQHLESKDNQNSFDKHEAAALRHVLGIVTQPKREPLTDEQKFALIEKCLGLKKRTEDTVIDRYTGLFTDSARYFSLIDATEKYHNIKE